MAALLEVKNLFKKYQDIPAVDGVSFTVEQGVCFGLLGPNGAGKTTTIEVIEDVIAPTTGEIFYKGKPRNASFKDEVGIQFQTTSLLSLLTVRETLEAFQNLYRKTATIDDLVEVCRLTKFQNQYNDQISGGQRQRFLLALALINQPDLLILDEPSTGLDPQARQNLWQIVQKIKSEGRTIILTTHYMEEAEYLCDEIAIMDNGLIIASGTPDDLIRKHGGETAVSLPKAALESVSGKLPFEYRERQERIELITDNVDTCLQTLIREKVDMGDLNVRTPNLESVFLNLTGRQLRE